MIFLIDFAYNLAGSKPKRAYFIYAAAGSTCSGRSRASGSSSSPPCSAWRGSAGWHGSRGCCGGRTARTLVDDVLENRGQYATFITFLSPAWC